jgi:hypothetical protein
MAVLLSRVTGNLTTASTWGLVDSTSYLNSESGATQPPSSAGASARSAGFTPGAITIDAIALKPQVRGAGARVTVELWNNTDSVLVSGTTVTVNIPELQSASSTSLEGGWAVFKFASSVTLIAAKSYMVQVTLSGPVANLILFTNGTANNWSRALRTTTTQAPAAGDDMIVAGENTGTTTAATFTGNVTGGSPTITSVSSFTGLAVGQTLSGTGMSDQAITALNPGGGTITINTNSGATGTGATLTAITNTGNDLTVTNNQTAATDYGSNTNSTATPAMSVCKRGTLKWADGSAANPKLRLSGHLIVYSGGTLNIGTTGTPIPRDSVAILEFDPAADGDMGLIGRNGSTVNIQGLSRTSGKNVWKTLLTADYAGNVAASGGGIGVSAATSGAFGNDPSGLTVITNNQYNGNVYTASVVDSATNSVHFLVKSNLSFTGGATYTVALWMARGTGTNNRYARLAVSTNNLTLGNGFYADIDLQAGTIGSCTAINSGTATSSSITAVGSGYLCVITGVIQSTSGTAGLIMAAANSLGGITYVGDTTMNYYYYNPQLYQASSVPSTLTIADDTGWKSGDVIAIASTTRNNYECESLLMSADAGASSIVCSVAPMFAHSGTSPTQAEIILLTRNVKIRSTSATLMAYCFFDTTATVDIDWAEFYYLGENAGNKRGIEVATTTGSFLMQFSSIHDCEDMGFYVAGASANNITFSSNAMWNCASTIGPAINVSSATTGVPVLDSNIIMRTLNSNCVTLLDSGLTFTNNTLVGATQSGVAFAEASAPLGTFTGNVAHSTGNLGFSTTTGMSGTISGGASWRNTGTGISLTSTPIDLIVDGMALFGNTTQNISFGAGDTTLKNLTVSGDTTFPTTSGIIFTSTNAGRLIIDNCDFGTASGIKTAHTQDINVSVVTATQTIMRNTKLASSTEVATPSNLRSGGFVSSQKHDQTAGNHVFWLVSGKGQTDTTFYNTASPSIRLTPTSATVKMESAPKDRGMQVAVASGATATVSVYIRKSAAGDGTAYSGNQPRLIQRANPALGQDSDVVLATYSGGTGSWAQISGTTSTATDDGCWEIVVDADGTAGWINVDDFAVT